MLVKTLTGVNTDRLKEEKLRGITIELGFAALTLPGGRRMGIVDVPGHERFVRHMVAGATGIDMVALVIAADEGVMPQTREHMDICTLLGVRHGLVVLTKVDMVDEEWLALAQEDVQDFVRGTFLEGAPVLPVSSVTGQGIPELLATLEDIGARIPARSGVALFRLPVDRAFTMKGFGTVVTGTLVSGRVATGDAVMIYPGGTAAKVRGVQVHGEKVDEAIAGQRTAVNFQGLSLEEVHRGDVVSEPDALVPGFMVDVSLRYLPGDGRPLKNRARVRFHAGTGEVGGLVVLLDREEVSPGDIVAAQMRLDAPMALVRDDRYVIRGGSPIRTIGGGAVLNPVPRKHRRRHPEVAEGVRRLMDMTPEQTVDHHAAEAGPAGISHATLTIVTNLPAKRLDGVIQASLTAGRLALADRERRLYLHRRALEELKSRITEQLGAYHERNPLKPGMPVEELKSRLPGYIPDKVTHLVLTQALRAGTVVREADVVRLATHRVSLASDQADVRSKLLAVYEAAGLTPPYLTEFCEKETLDPAQAKDVAQLLVKEGHLVRVKDNLYFHAPAVAVLRETVVGFLKRHGELTTPQFKDIAGVSRKYLIPLIEHFDATQVTIRVGENRKLRHG